MKIYYLFFEVNLKRINFNKSILIFHKNNQLDQNSNIYKTFKIQKDAQILY